MSKNKIIISLLLIVLLAIFLRVFRFGQVPPSLNWDEAAIGWNAMAIWEARIDEFGHRFPLSFQSFGDFKAPFYIYLSAPLVGLLGLEPWVVRLPSLLAGIVVVVLIFGFTKEICQYLKIKKKYIDLFVLGSSLLVAILPWHIMYSRGAYEANLALMFIVAGTWFFLLGLKRWYFLFLSGLSFLLSLYTYHSPKLFVPLFVLALILVFFKNLKKQFQQHKIVLAISLLALVVLTGPMAYENIMGKGADRAGSSVYFTNEGEARNLDLNLAVDVVSNFVKHLDPTFYIWGNSENYRNKLNTYGLISPIQFAFFIIGLIYLLKNWKYKGSKFLILWYLLGLLPGVIGRSDEVPHTIRSFNSLPAMVIILIYGFSQALLWLKQKLSVRKITIILLGLLLLIVIDYGRFCKEYFYDFPVYAVTDWQYGYEELADFIQDYEGEVEQIIISPSNGQPHVFIYFFQKRSPQGVLWGVMNKYLFREITWHGDKFSKNHLLVGTAEEIPASIQPEYGEIVGQIFYPNGSVAFRIVKTSQDL